MLRRNGSIRIPRFSILCCRTAYSIRLRPNSGLVVLEPAVELYAVRYPDSLGVSPLRGARTALTSYDGRQPRHQRGGCYR
jgi:hypothetical protein